MSASLTRLDALESRVLLAASPHIVSAIADNRGLMLLASDIALDPATINRNTVLMSTIGKDRLWGTADDVKLAPTISYIKATRQISVEAPLKANTAYRIILVGKSIKSTLGAALDGEFNGASVASGNGVAGGNYNVITKTAKTPIARFTSNVGAMNIQLSSSLTPLTYKNFVFYANSKRFDGTMIHRSVANFIIQGGGAYLVGNNLPIEVRKEAGITKEAGLSNLRGTLSMARGAALDSASSEWFINTVDNVALDTYGGGYTAFGQITDASGLKTLDKIAAYQTVNATSWMQNQIPVDFQNIPVKNYATASSTQTVAPNNIIVMNRIAMLFSVVSSASVIKTVQATAVPASAAEAPAFSTVAISAPAYESAASATVSEDESVLA